MFSLSLLFFNLVHIFLLNLGGDNAAADDLDDGPDHGAVGGSARALRPPFPW